MRKAPRGIIAAAAMGASLAGGLMVLAVGLARPALRRATFSGIVTEEHRAACEANPASWGWESGGLSFHAYDLTGHSVHPKAPPLEPELLAETRRTGSVADLDTPGRLRVLVPLASRGPCALLRITSRDIFGLAASWLLPLLASTLVVGMLLAAVLSFVFVLRPLRRRVAALATSARKVGTASFVAEPSGEDALGVIADVLARSHARVVSKRAALVERNRALEEHMAGIAHDLRTPLTSMHLALESLAKKAEGRQPVETRQAIADVVYLSSLVENLHQATRLRREVEVSGQVELSELVRRLEKRFALIGRHAGVEVAAHAPDEEVWAACAPALTERAVSNLVQNAIEHNDEAGHVAVTLTQRDGRFELVVADDGPGLPEYTNASLDEATFLAEGPRPRGPGLGMLITAEIARRAGWELRYEAGEPRGLRAHLEGPVIGAPSNSSTELSASSLPKAQ
ncbi:MAG: HAMP domain-containing sensor histidine kinase [Myxococcota bacterium]